MDQEAYDFGSTGTFIDDFRNLPEVMTAIRMFCHLSTLKPTIRGEAEGDMGSEFAIDVAIAVAS